MICGTRHRDGVVGSLLMLVVAAVLASSSSSSVLVLLGGTTTTTTTIGVVEATSSSTTVMSPVLVSSLRSLFTKKTAFLPLSVTDTSVITASDIGIDDENNTVRKKKKEVATASALFLSSVRGGGGGRNKKKKTVVVDDDPHSSDDDGASIATSVFNLANNVAGAGILTLAAGKATSHTGWIPALLICVTLASLSSHTFALVGKSCELLSEDFKKEAPSPQFKDLWEYAFQSKESAWIVDSMVFTQCFFVSIIYTGLLGDVFSALLRGTLGIEKWYTTRTSLIVLASTCLLFPLNLIRDLSSLGFTSILGLLSVLYTVGFMVVRALDGSYNIGSSISTLDGGKAVGTFILDGSLTGRKVPSFTKSTLWNCDFNALVLISNLGLAFIAHYNGPSYWKSLKTSATSKKFTKISQYAYTILACIYVTTMSAGYATFGDASLGNILLNYSSNDKLALLGRVATGLSIIFGFPLISNGCREGFKNTLSSLQLQPFATTVSNPQNHTPLVLCLLLVTTSLSIVAKDIGLVAGLTGAIMGSSLVYICPPLLYTKIIKRKYGVESNEYKSAKKNLLFIPFGVFTACMGLLMTLKNAFFV